MTKLVLKKALFNKSEDLEIGDDAQQLEKFRKLILDHLSTLDDDEPEEGTTVKKAFSKMIIMLKSGLPVGTIHTYRDGKKYIKSPSGKWIPKYDSHTRGAKMAIAAIKRKIAATQDAQTMMQIILENRDRFSDKNGQPLPFVQELSKYISSEQDRQDQAKQEKSTSGKKEKKDKKRQENVRNSGDAVKAVQPMSEDKGVQEKTPEKDNPDKLAREMYNNLAHERHPKDKFLSDIKRGLKKFPDDALERIANERSEDIEHSKAELERIYQRSHGAPIKQKRKREVFLEDYAIRLNEIENADDITELVNAELERRGLSNEPSRRDQEAKKTDSGESDFNNIKKKYQSAKSFEGDDDQIQVGKELISGKWKLVEADTPTASHDETSFHKTPGFPTTDDGSTINDRDYGHDREAQEIVMEIGSDYDGRAVSVDNPVIVTKDGIVISGNNRTMSSKIAARKGTDKGYIEALKRKAKKFGFTLEQVDKFKHPRVVFETAENKGYSTDQFAKFNKSSKKAMSPVEAAVKVSKTIKMDTVESIAGKMIDFETLGELYADRNVVNDIFNTLQRDNIITPMDRPQYVVDGGITGAGKEFLETVLIGSVINESNIRGLNREGCKSIRQKLVRAITPLIENKGMDGYSVTKELNEAVDIAMQVAIQKDKFKSVDDYASQKTLFGIEDDPVSMELARKLEGTQKEFAAFMQSMNGGLKYAANGEADIFLGDVESREDILARMLNLKKAINNVIDLFRNLRAGKGPRFIKKAVPIQDGNGETELSERWMQESIEGIAPYVEEAGVSNTGAKVVAVDFDGVINSYISGWKGPTETDVPVLSAAESLQTLYNRGYKVIIFSTRANTQEGIDTIREYLRKHTENNELADTIEITDQKPIADMYIDDRAIPFNGDWEETLAKIETFEPWMKKSNPNHDVNGRFTFGPDTGGLGGSNFSETQNQKNSMQKLNNEDKIRLINAYESYKRSRQSFDQISEYQGYSKSSKSKIRKIFNEMADSNVEAYDAKFVVDGEYARNEKTLKFYIEKIGERGRQISSRKLAQEIGYHDMDNLQNMLRGLSVKYPELLNYSTTHDLDLVSISEVEKSVTAKSLTWSGFPLQGRTKVHGMDISIENKKGGTRSGTDKDGHDWSIKMNFDYGYIRGTVGKDKDHVDCYIGPNPESETVFIVHQNDPATGEYDEDKVMLGFESEKEAREAYLSQYDRPDFLGEIDAMDIETFKDKAFDPKNKGKKLRG